MRVLITGAAGNLGSALARRMLHGPRELRLLIHRTPLPFDVSGHSNVSVHAGDLAAPQTLWAPCAGVDCIVHFAGVLFAPRPERFLPETNLGYVKNLVDVATRSGARKLILISFPHVEGESSEVDPARGGLAGEPGSVHARTRLAAEKYLFQAAGQNGMAAVSLRSGMIYGRGVLMVEAVRWLAKRKLLCVWREPTWIHLLSLPDFLSCVMSAIEGPEVEGVYNLGDDGPVTLQGFLNTITRHWGYDKPWRLPGWMFHFAACFCEAYATIFRTRSYLTRDFIRIGRVPYFSDTSRMEKELLPELAYPTLREGLALL